MDKKLNFKIWVDENNIIEYYVIYIKKKYLQFVLFDRFYFESISQKETHHSLIKYRVPDECKLIK